MKNILTLFFIFFSLTAFTQQIVFSQDVKADSVRPTRGPNLKNFTHPYSRLEFPFKTNGESDYTRPGISTVMNWGIRYKRKVNNTLALGFDASLNLAAYRIKQTEGKSVPDSIINKKAKFQVSSLTPAVYARINVGRRGNLIGKYLDLGAYGSWNFKKAYKTTNKNNRDELVKVTTSRLTYMENFSYGFLARIGINHWALVARYRMSNLFKDNPGLPELPRFSAGVELGIFK